MIQLLKARLQASIDLKTSLLTNDAILTIDLFFNCTIITVALSEVFILK